MRTVSGMDLRELVKTIYDSTTVLPEHPDRGSVHDCWMELFETVDRMYMVEVTGRGSKAIRELEELIDETKGRGSR